MPSHLKWHTYIRCVDAENRKMPIWAWTSTHTHTSHTHSVEMCDVRAWGWGWLLERLATATTAAATPSGEWWEKVGLWRARTAIIADKNIHTHNTTDGDDFDARWWCLTIIHYTHHTSQHIPHPEKPPDYQKLCISMYTHTFTYYVLCVCVSNALFAHSLARSHTYFIFP